MWSISVIAWQVPSDDAWRLTPSEWWALYDMRVEINEAEAAPEVSSGLSKSDVAELKKLNQAEGA